MTTTRKTYLSKVMKAAWTIFRKGGKTFSQSLKKAWAWAKKKFNQQPQSFYVKAVSHVRETAKAVCFNYETEDAYGAGWESLWLPKSAFIEIDGRHLNLHGWGFKMLQEKLAAKGANLM